MTRLQIASDLHLEFVANKSWLKAKPLEPAAEILILAGDVLTFAGMDKHDDFFSFLADHFEHTYWVPGNHEYYQFDMETRSGAFKEEIRSNVTLLNNETVVIDGARLHFSTLWSKISPAHAQQIEHGMNDFRLIKRYTERLTVEDYNLMHQQGLDFLKAALLEDHAAHEFVVTHHIPTFQHYPAKYLGSTLNEAFASNQDELILALAPDYWIYGHHHAAIPDFSIGSTRMITNQLGYVEYDEHRNFEVAKVLVLD